MARECGTDISCKEPNPTGSRQRDLIGLCRKHTKPHPQTQGKAVLFKRETEHLCLRQPIHWNANLQVYLFGPRFLLLTVGNTVKTLSRTPTETKIILSFVSRMHDHVHRCCCMLCNEHNMVCRLTRCRPAANAQKLQPRAPRARPASSGSRVLVFKS